MVTRQIDTCITNKKYITNGRNGVLARKQCTPRVTVAKRLPSFGMMCSISQLTSAHPFLSLYIFFCYCHHIECFLFSDLRIFLLYIHTHKGSEVILSTLRNIYYNFLGGITRETNFDLILSSSDDVCFQIVILFLVSAHCVSSSLKNRITVHYPDSQVISAGTSYTYLLQT